jgi:hypothetical protein
MIVLMGEILKYNCGDMNILAIFLNEDEKAICNLIIL